MLARRPQLALVDELAHTNAPGSRHPKRYMDVEELLAAGIDVYTTLNVQHVESLNDVVARITRIRVRETVPDSIIDKADDIELIDLTPDGPDPAAARRQGLCAASRPSARIRHYFSPGNLTALRELALRRTAQRVDEQMVRYMRRTRSPGPWAAGERMLVCVDPGPDAANTVRARQAHGRQPDAALDRALCRDRPACPAERGRAGDGSPRRCGWPSGSAPRWSRCPDARSSRKILAFARSRNVTHIVVGQVPPLALVRAAAWLGGRPAGAQRIGPCRAKWRRPATRPSPPVRIDWLLGAAADHRPLPRGHADDRRSRRPRACCINDYVGLPNISLIFVVPGPGRGGAARAVAVALGVGACRVLAYNFFFLPPLYPFTIADPANVARAVLLHVRGGRRERAGDAHPRPDRGRPARGAHHRRALCLQPQDRRRDRPRRPAVDRGDPSRPADERGDRHPDAGEEPVGDRQAGAARRLSARQRFQRSRPRRGALVVGRRAADRARHRHAARRALAVHADPHQPLVDRRDRRAVQGRRRASSPRPPAGCSRRWATRPPWRSSG